MIKIDVTFCYFWYFLWYPIILDNSVSLFWLVCKLVKQFDKILLLRTLHTSLIPMIPYILDHLFWIIELKKLAQNIAGKCAGTAYATAAMYKDVSLIF